MAPEAFFWILGLGIFVVWFPAVLTAKSVVGTGTTGQILQQSPLSRYCTQPRTRKTAEASSGGSAFSAISLSAVGDEDAFGPLRRDAARALSALLDHNIEELQMATITATTGLQFDAMPFEEGRKWELIDGELIPVSSPTPRHQDIVFRILLAVRRYFEGSKAPGLAYQDVEFALTDKHRVRPDVCVLLGDKAGTLDPDRTPLPGAPDIAIEVISPTERASESHDKVRAYLRNGTAEVWQVYPKSRTVQLHRGEISRSFELGQEVVTNLLPGFVLPLSTLFE